MKELKDMSLEELWQLFPIILEEHNLKYREWYEEERTNIISLLHNYDACRINHIGSTAVEGLIAKPIIDILLELPNGYDMESVSLLLRRDSWVVMQQDNANGTIDLNKGYTSNGFAEKVYHLHLRPVGDWGELYFRDYLRQNMNVAKEYEELKLPLARKYKNNRDEYTEAKSEFILENTLKAREEYNGKYRIGD